MRQTCGRLSVRSAQRGTAATRPQTSAQRRERGRRCCVDRVVRSFAVPQLTMMAQRSGCEAAERSCVAALQERVAQLTSSIDVESVRERA